MAEVYIAPHTGNYGQSYRHLNKLPMIAWDNMANRNNLTASTTLSDEYSIANVVDDNTVDYWQSLHQSTLRHTITVQVGAGKLFNCVALSRHNIATIGGTVEVFSRGNTYAKYKPKTDGTLIIVMPESLSSTYIEVRITGDGERIGRAKIYNLFVGNRMVIPNGIDGTGFNPIEFSTRTQLVQNETLAGNLLGNYITRSGVEVDIPFNFVEKDFLYGPFKEFVSHYNSGKPFFLASSPSFLPNDAGFLWRDGDDMDVSLIDVGYNATFSMPARGITG